MSKITAYAALSSVASSDVLPIVDISDTSMAASGTTKKVTVAEALTAGAVYNVLNPAYSGGADPTGAADSAAAIQAAFNTVPPGGTVLIPPGDYSISSGVTLSANAVTVRGGGWAQTASSDGSRIFAPTGFTGTMITLAGEGIQMTGVTIDAANHADTCIAVTGARIQLYYMQARACTTGGVCIDVQSGGDSAYLHTVNINGVNGGTGLQVAGTDLIMTACKPQNSLVNVILLSGSSGALLEANHWTPGSSSQTCVQVNGNPSNLALVGNRFDNYVRSALQFSLTTSTPQNVLIASNIFKSTVMTDATYALIGVDTTSFGVRDLHIVGNVAYASGTNRPAAFLTAQTAAGAAASNPTRLSTNGTVCSSNGAWVSGAFFGTSSTPTVARGNMITTDGTTYSAVTDT